jgi:hypothetical protein
MVLQARFDFVPIETLLPSVAGLSSTAYARGFRGDLSAFQVTVLASTSLLTHCRPNRVQVPTPGVCGHGI